MVQSEVQGRDQGYRDIGGNEQDCRWSQFLPQLHGVSAQSLLGDNVCGRR